MSEITSTTHQSRGPADHNVREQILEAAGEHFSHYGYDKTTVSDLAKAIGFRRLTSTSSSIPSKPSARRSAPKP
jgi:hypothetical protein